ncbi:MAG: hypothetical protein AAF514_14560 [Verrucomicrobiota bacterium]
MRDHPGDDLSFLVAALAPPPPGPKPAEPTESEIAVLKDLRWLVREGHVLEFSNGELHLVKDPGFTQKITLGQGRRKEVEGGGKKNPPKGKKKGDQASGQKSPQKKKAASAPAGKDRGEKALGDPSPASSSSPAQTEGQASDAISAPENSSEKTTEPEAERPSTQAPVASVDSGTDPGAQPDEATNQCPPSTVPSDKKADPPSGISGNVAAAGALAAAGAAALTSSSEASEKMQEDGPEPSSSPTSPVPDSSQPPGQSPEPARTPEIALSGGALPVPVRASCPSMRKHLRISPINQIKAKRSSKPSQNEDAAEETGPWMPFLARQKQKRAEQRRG